MTPALVVWLLLSQAPAAPVPGAQPSARLPEQGYVLTRLEANALGLRPGTGADEAYAQLTPILVVDAGTALGLQVGAPVRLRLWGGEVGAGRVREEDWDSLSDWGQLVRALKLGSDTSPVALWVGALQEYSLPSSHLVQRYSNRNNPNYHPAGAFLTGTLGPLHLEAFTSDVLGARLMGSELELDLARLFNSSLAEPGRYLLAVSAAHEWGRAGGDSPQVTLAHVDGTVLGQGGTLLFPTAAGALQPGAYASLGLGVDNARW